MIYQKKISHAQTTTADNENLFKPIGFIRTVFSEKRAVPRQPSVNRLLGRIEISQNVFNNPEHSLDGLNSFSHLWIIYHFHRNESHAKAKVAPPRLGGSRVGVFSTRSPHRPCPIGLSLVEIDKIDDKSVYFYGTDMVDGKRFYFTGSLGCEELFCLSLIFRNTSHGHKTIHSCI